MNEEPSVNAEVDEARDAARRTRLANERTYLAWWRTGLTTLAVSVGAGRLIPELSQGPNWPFELALPRVRHRNTFGELLITPEDQRPGATPDRRPGIETHQGSARRR